LLADPARRAELGRGAVAAVASDFALDVQLAKMAHILQSVAAGSALGAAPS
jgi:hypothetical protein